jgi:hypothetical protein
MSQDSRSGGNGTRGDLRRLITLISDQSLADHTATYLQTTAPLSGPRRARFRSSKPRNRLLVEFLNCMCHFRPGHASDFRCELALDRLLPINHGSHSDSYDNDAWR